MGRLKDLQNETNGKIKCGKLFALSLHLLLTSLSAYAKMLQYGLDLNLIRWVTILNKLWIKRRNLCNKAKEITQSIAEEQQIEQNR